MIEYYNCSIFAVTTVPVVAEAVMDSSPSLDLKRLVIAPALKLAGSSWSCNGKLFAA
jgi:hypothetical protein